MRKFIIILIILYFVGTSWYFKYLNSTIDILKENNILLQTANQENVQTLNSMKSRYTEIININYTLNTELFKTRDRITVLEISLKNINQKLEKTAKAKPGLVETRINNATQKTIKCFESLSRGNTCED